MFMYEMLLFRGAPPHVLENKALFDRFGVPSDLLLQDLTFEDEQAKKVSPTQVAPPHGPPALPGAWKLTNPLPSMALCAAPSTLGRGAS